MSITVHPHHHKPPIEVVFLRPIERSNDMTTPTNEVVADLVSRLDATCVKPLRNVHPSGNLTAACPVNLPKRWPCWT